MHKCGNVMDAARCFQQAIAQASEAPDDAFMRSCAQAAKDNLRDLSSGAIDRWHYRMLNDRVRNLMYQVRGRQSMLEFIGWYPLWPRPRRNDTWWRCRQPSRRQSRAVATRPC